MQALDRMQQLMGLLSTSDLMDLPRKYLKQKKIVEVFSDVVFCFGFFAVFECYFSLSKPKRPTSLCHICIFSPLVGRRF